MTDFSHLLLVFLSAVLRFLPDLFLVLTPFHGHFHRSVKMTYALTALCALLFALGAPPLYFSFKQSGSPSYPIALSTLYMAAMLVPLRFLAIVPFSKLLFVFFIVRSCTDTMRFFHKFLELRFIPRTVQLYDPTSCFIANFLTLLLSLPFLWLFLRKILRPLLEQSNDLPTLRYLWIIPASYFILYRLSVYSGSFETDFHDYKILFLQCVWILVTCLSYYIVLRMASETTQNIALQEKLKIETLQVTQQTEQYKTLQRNIAQAAVARRDLRDRLSRIKECAARGDYDEIQCVLESSLASIRAHEGALLCDNSAADAMLRHYLALSRQHGIAFSASAELPAKPPVTESDLCIVLGNLLENALEACLRQNAGQRFIELKIRVPSSHMVALTVKNSYDGEIHTLAGDFVSSKRDGESFGIGTASVRAIAEKNGGVAKYVVDRGVFQSFALLVAPTEKQKSS